MQIPLLDNLYHYLTSKYGISKILIIRSSPNDMEQLLKISNLYLKPILTKNFEILKSREIEILSLDVKKNVK